MSTIQVSDTFNNPHLFTVMSKAIILYLKLPYLLKILADCLNYKAVMIFLILSLRPERTPKDPFVAKTDNKFIFYFVFYTFYRFGLGKKKSV